MSEPGSPVEPAASSYLLAVALMVTAASAALKGIIALREATGGVLGLRVWDPGGQPALFFVRLAACVTQTAAVWLVATGLLNAWARRPDAPRRFIRLLATPCAVFATMLMVANVQVFHVFHRFLDAGLIIIGQGGGHGYIQPYATPGILIPFLLVPGLFGATTRFLAATWRDDLEAAARVVWHPVFLLVLVAALWSAGDAAERRWCGQGRGDFAHDPVVVFAQSCVVLLRGAPAPGSDLTAAEVAALAPLPVTPPAPGPIKNVVLVVWDGVPAAALSIYGSPHRTTPELARRTDTLVFDRFHSNATQSAPSALALFGSTYNDPSVYVTTLAYPRFPVPHAATWLEGRGFETMFVGDDGWTSLGDTYLKPFQVAVDAWTDWSRRPGQRERPRFQVAASSYGVARKLIAQAGDHPFFATIWSSEAHPPFRAGECPEHFDASKFPELSETKAGDYARFLACCWREDHELAGLLADLERSGQLAHTLVVVTADHGCGWGQHGYFGYGAGLYDEIVRVPLVLISPALAHGRSAAVGTHVDLWPTVCRLLGVPANPEWQGRDLLEPAAAGRTAYFSCQGEMGLREGQWKYIWAHGRDAQELYDLTADPGEQANVAGAHADLAARFQRKLAALATYQSTLVRARSH